MGTAKRWIICGVVAVATLAAVPAAWAADNRSDAETLFYDDPVTTDVSAFTVEPGELNTVENPGPCGAMARTNWLRLEGTGTKITVTIESSSATVLAVDPVGPGDPVCSGPSEPGMSTLQFTSDKATIHYIQAGVSCSVDPTCADAATRTIRVTATNADAPPNDQREMALPIALNSHPTADNRSATVQPGEVTFCPAGGAHYGKTVWFEFRIPRGGDVRILAGGPGANSVIAVFEPASAIPRACNDEGDLGDSRSVLALDLAAGDYQLQLGGFRQSETDPATATDFPLAIDFTPNFDLDGDGARSPAGGGQDCNDNDPLIHPGAPDPPNDTIDQNCDGHDSQDRDRDGALAPPDGADCDDANDAIRPGAPDPPNDGIDQNCDGQDAEDVDRDGALAPPDGADCNDKDPSIRPGAPDPPNDKIDQNCDGHDPKDLDRDGSLAAPDGADCNDADAAIKPGVPDIAANSVDENCDGVSSLGQVSSTLQFGFDRVGCRGAVCRGVRLTKYTVVGIPAGATVELRCTGKGCPFAVTKTVVKNATARLSRLAQFKHRMLKRGAVLRLTVTAPYRVGAVKTQIVGKRNLSSPKPQCLPPGATKPSACDG